MFAALVDQLYRSAVLVVLGLAPFISPLEIRRSSGGARTVIVRAFVGSVLLLGLASAAFRIRRRTPTTAALLAALTVASLVSAFIFRGARGPLAVAVWIVSPLSWCALSCLAATTVARRWLRNTKDALILGAVCSCATLVVAVPRISSRSRMWTAIAARDPGNEEAALAMAKDALARGDRTTAIAAWSGCAAANSAACSCGANAAEGLLFDDAVEQAAALSERMRDSCPADGRFSGLLAETLARSGRLDVAGAEAERALAKNPHDPHALFARATRLLALGAIDDALPAALEARASNVLGVEAAVIVDRVWIARGDLDMARSDLATLSAANPNSATLVYLLGQIEDRRDHYHDAREHYLAALRIDPRFADARYMLALLTFRHGAIDEAKNDVAQLASIAPNDPRVADLRRLLDVH